MTDDTEQTFRDGLAQLVRDKPNLGRIDADEVIARGGSDDSSSTGRRPLTRWLAVAAALMLIVGLGVGIWAVGRKDSRLITANPVPTATPTSGTAARLAGTRWLATRIKGDPVVPDRQGRAPDLQFEGNDRIIADDTCNSLSGTYRLVGDRLTLSDVAISAVGCLDDLGDQRAAYADAFGKASRIKIAEPTLTLYDAADQPVLVFRAAADSSAPSAATVLIRIRNDSASRLEQLRVGFGRRSADYGTIEPGEETDYQSVGLAYRYAAIHTSVAAKELSIQPIDYVGETPLPVGRYTYVITLDGGSLDLTLEADQ